MPGVFDPNLFDPALFDTEELAEDTSGLKPAASDPETYGDPVYEASLWDTDTYGEWAPPEVQVDTSLEFEYAVIAPALKNLTFTYAIDELVTTQVGDNLEIDYAIGTAGGAHKDLTFTYVVTKASKVHQRGADLKLRWRITGATKAGKSLSFAYVIQTPRVTVGKNLTFTFVTEPPLSVAGCELTFDYLIESPRFVVGASLQLDAIIEQNDVAGVDEGFTFEVEQPRPRTSYTFGYEVEAATPFVDLTFDAPIEVLADQAGTELEFEYTVREAIEAELNIDYVVREAVGSALTIDYEVEQATGLASATLSLGYAIAGTVDVELTFDAPVEASSRRRRVGVIRQQYAEPLRHFRSVSKSLHLGWAIANLVGADLDLESWIGTSVGRQASFGWRINTLVGTDATFSYRVMTFWEQNQNVLLAEIDQDLADLVASR